MIHAAGERPEGVLQAVRFDDLNIADEFSFPLVVDHGELVRSVQLLALTLVE